MDKPFSQACENNKGPILTLLKQHFASATRVLEIGSGTGQHAVHFARYLPHLSWQTSDQVGYHAGIRQWLEEAGLANVNPPIAVKIGEHRIRENHYDGIFTANTAHIMQKQEVQQMMGLVASALLPGGVFCQYGPFTRDGRFSSDSNAEFHRHLIAQGYGGYRDLTELQQWAEPLILTQVTDMPANNLLLVWKKL